MSLSVGFMQEILALGATHILQRNLKTCSHFGFWTHRYFGFWCVVPCFLPWPFCTLALTALALLSFPHWISQTENRLKLELWTQGCEKLSPSRLISYGKHLIWKFWQQTDKEWGCDVFPPTKNCRKAVSGSSMSPESKLGTLMGWLNSLS